MTTTKGPLWHRILTSLKKENPNCSFLTCFIIHVIIYNKELISKKKNVTVRNCARLQYRSFELSFLMSRHQMVGRLPASLPISAVSSKQLLLLTFWEVRWAGCVESCVVNKLQLSVWQPFQRLKTKASDWEAHYSICRNLWKKPKFQPRRGCWQVNIKDSEFSISLTFCISHTQGHP